MYHLLPSLTIICFYQQFICIDSHGHCSFSRCCRWIERRCCKRYTPFVGRRRSCVHFPYVFAHHNAADLFLVGSRLLATGTPLLCAELVLACRSHQELLLTRDDELWFGTDCRWWLWQHLRRSLLVRGARRRPCRRLYYDVTFASTCQRSRRRGSLTERHLLLHLHRCRWMVIIELACQLGGLVGDHGGLATPNSCL